MVTAHASPAVEQMAAAMRSIGYTDKHIQRSFPMAASIGADVPDPVPLAGFAQTPFSYRTSCIAVLENDHASAEHGIVEYREFGAPLVFLVAGSEVQRWRMNADTAPELLDRIPLRQIGNAFTRNREEWSPQTIYRAKNLRFANNAFALDFLDPSLLPLLAGQFQNRLDQLVQHVVRSAIDSAHRNLDKPLDTDVLYRLLFRLLAAKVLRDRKHPGAWNSDDPRVILKAVEQHYRLAGDRLGTVSRLNRSVMADAWEAISSGPLFQNLAPDDLAFVYENTFVTSETRKRHGTHGTPVAVAEYIVGKLPFEELDEKSRHVFEPCSGHGVFLVAAMRRLRELLPADTPPAKRHKYLVERLTGMEIDPFACEVNRLCLMLADFPNPNGWSIHNDDVFTSKHFDEHLRQSSIVLCNPPFEAFDAEEKSAYGAQIATSWKPAELARRIMASPPALLGLVLPTVAVSGLSYRDFRAHLARHYGTIETVGLPDHVFCHSDAETVLIMAHKRRGDTACFVSTSVVTREFSKDKWTLFARGGEEPYSRAAVWRADSGESARIWVPRTCGVWSYLKQMPTLGEVVEFSRGMQFIGKDAAFRKGLSPNALLASIPTVGYRAGYHEVAGGALQQFVLSADRKYLCMDPELQHERDRAYLRAWGQPKVACNAAALSRGPWRLAAVYDPEGLAFSKGFFAAWQTGQVSLLSVLAILNSPLANAYLYAYDDKRDNHIRTLRTIPIPSAEQLQTHGIDDRVSTLLCLLGKDKLMSSVDTDKLHRALLELDAALLKAYDLPPRLERELLDTFQGHKRPFPRLDFHGYYPEGMQAYIPLHELISQEFAASTAGRILDRLKPNRDPDISRMLTWLTQPD